MVGSSGQRTSRHEALAFSGHDSYDFRMRLFPPRAALFVLLSPCWAPGQEALPDIRITELIASNDEGLEDAEGRTPDWIELHNAGTSAVNLSGLFLTDDPDVPGKWPLPEVSLGAGGYLVIFSSGRNLTDPAFDLHTNFKLSSRGEFLALNAANGRVVDLVETPDGVGYPVQKPNISFGVGSSARSFTETLLASNAACTWLVPAGETGDGWKERVFDDAAWNQGKTGVGFGYPGLVGEGSDAKTAMRGLNATVHVRVPFEVENSALVTAMTLRMKYEDGFVAFINGKEIARANAPDALPYNATATASHPDDAAEQFELFPVEVAGLLVDGENVLAIHGLNLSASGSNSSDFLALPELEVTKLESGGSTVTGYFESPTPGAPNGAVDFTRFLEPPTMDVERGFYTEPFTVTVTSSEPGATLVFTTDASTPTAENGVRVDPEDAESYAEAQVEITTTSVIRAVNLKEGFPARKTTTSTYFFLEDVLDQPDDPEGYPDSWFSAGAADYEMDPDIVGEVYSREEIMNALRDLPTISLVSDVPNLFDRRAGIQTNPQRTGPSWEKPSSIELIDFEDGEPVQLDCGWRMSGNASRSPTRPKHNLRIVFRPAYDVTPLEYPLFGTLEEQRFRTFILRGGNGDSWVHPQNYPNGQYIRDQWFRDAHKAMGHEETLQRYVHVYFNGLYWGVHHLFERTEDDFAVEHFGGLEEEWDGIRITAGGNLTTIDGTLDAWLETRTLARAGDYVGVQNYLDLDEFIDYLLINFYGGNGDWDQNNVRGLRRRTEDGRWHFFCHDSERAGLNAGGGSLRIDVTNKNTSRGPTEMHQSLARTSEEYRIRFADRVHKHFFNGGALTPKMAEALWRARAEEIREPLKAESARWGDAKRASRPMTLVEWERLVEREYNTWFPDRTEITLGQLRRRNLYPDLAAPVFSQHGGVIGEAFQLLITNEAGDIFYTLDGSDPRLEGGEPNPAATKIGGSTETVEVFPAGSEWRFLDTGADLGSSAVVRGAPRYEPTNWKHPEFDDDTWAQGGAPLGYGGVGSAEIVTSVDFGGDRGTRHLTTYFRKSFEIAEPTVITELSLALMRDDGAIVYLNGAEVVRSGMPGGEVGFDSTAGTNITGEAESEFERFVVEPAALLKGSNVLAVEVHQVSRGSSDLGFDLALEATRLNEDNKPIPITPGTLVKARSRDRGEWSALNEAAFVPGLAPGPASLVVSELHYNPPAPTPKELEQPFITDNDDFEFMELQNDSEEAIDLSGAAFVRGIDFVFPDGSVLEPGGFTLVVRSKEAFSFRYPGAGSQIAGEFANDTGLSNGGEWITLEDTNGERILNFRYNDREPWPTDADGGGASLVRVEGSSNPNVARNWMKSANTGGHPGASEPGSGFPSAEIDSDGNGLSDFLDYIFGNRPGDAVYPSVELVRDGDEASILITFRRRAGLEGVTLSVQHTEDLNNWLPLEGERLEEGATDASGRRTIVATIPVNLDVKGSYLRIRATAE